MPWHTLTLVSGLVLGYIYRGWLHREVISIGSRLKTAALRGENFLKSELHKIEAELKVLRPKK